MWTSAKGHEQTMRALATIDLYGKADVSGLARV
jgi:hypothetical protein